ncbi:glycosyltransferase [Halomonas alimentaria]|uniref:glycosyltransferase n=1 Tax=Halomonas alimentaria TaxID=147248 RepID=UPI0024911447|nr:glycosyltransferase [Halomonas alimentaria]
MLIIPYGGVGGMERLALNLYRHYCGLGDRVKVIKLVRLSDDIVNFGKDEIALSELDLVNMSPIQRVGYYFSIPLSIARAVRTHGITHSIALGDMGNLFSSLSPSCEFKVASIHALKSAELASNGALNRIFRLAYRTIYCRFNRVVCISRAIRNDLLTNCGYRFPDNLDVIYNPHDVRAISEDAAEALAPDEESLFSTQTVVFLGRLTDQKALWHLIRAFQALLYRGVEARLLFIGDGSPDLFGYLQSLVDGYGIGDQVTFLGRRSNPYKYLAHADVLALSSHFEGTPNVIVEAIALGVPVVSSHCTDGVVELMSTRDVVGFETPVELEAGIMTPPLTGRRDPITHETPMMPAELALADALAAVLGKPRFRESVRRNRGQLLEKFDLARSAQAYLAPTTKATVST